MARPLASIRRRALRRLPGRAVDHQSATRIRTRRGLPQSDSATDPPTGQYQAGIARQDDTCSRSACLAHMRRYPLELHHFAVAVVVVSPCSATGRAVNDTNNYLQIDYYRFDRLKNYM